MTRTISHLKAVVTYKKDEDVEVVPVSDFHYEGWFARWVEDRGFANEVLVYVPYDRIIRVEVR